MDSDPDSAFYNEKVLFRFGSDQPSNSGSGSTTLDSTDTVPIVYGTTDKCLITLGTVTFQISDTAPNFGQSVRFWPFSPRGERSAQFLMLKFLKTLKVL